MSMIYVLWNGLIPMTIHNILSRSFGSPLMGHQPELLTNFLIR